MKKILNLSFIYFLLAMAGGVFFREYTKFMNFEGTTTLGFLHTHLLVMGTFLFLVIALFAKDSALTSDTGFRKFMKLYNIALPFMSIMLLVRGILQVSGMEVSTGMNAAVSGLAGISHILMLVSLWMLLSSLKRTFADK